MFVPGYSVAQSVDIGGLDGEVKSIFRRAFASRMLPKQLIDKLQLSHVKGAFVCELGPSFVSHAHVFKPVTRNILCEENEVG